MLGAAGLEQRGERFGGVRGEDRIGGVSRGTAPDPDQIGVALAGGVADPILEGDADRLLPPGRLDHPSGQGCCLRELELVERQASVGLRLPDLLREHPGRGLAELRAVLGPPPPPPDAVPPQLPGAHSASPGVGADQRVLDPVERVLERAPRGAAHHRPPEPREPAQRPPPLERDASSRRRPRRAAARARRCAGTSRTACRRSAAPTPVAGCRSSPCSGSRRGRVLPRGFRSTWVKRLRRAPGSPSTDSTRTVPGHHRGRLWGSANRSQTRSRSIAIDRERATVGIGREVRERYERSRRRSRTSSRCLSCVQVAARPSRLSRASSRRAWLRERSDGPRICSSSAASRSAAVRKTRRFRPWTPKRASSVGGPHDLEVGLVEGHLAALPVGLHDSELLELTDQLGGGAGLLEQLLDRDRPVRGLQRQGAALGRTLGLTVARAADLAGGQLLADHLQRQELVALHPQDRSQLLDIGLAVEPVTATRAARREQLLILEIADLGDRDVLELLAEDLADGADRQRLAGPRGRIAAAAPRVGSRLRGRGVAAYRHAQRSR